MFIDKPYNLNSTPHTRLKWYVGHENGRMVIFQADAIPTFTSHGEVYAAVIGPFRTKRGALFMAQYGRGNPHCRTVSEAERLAKKYA